MVEHNEDTTGSELKTMAIKLLSIVPHSASCERVFSILGWIHTKTINRMDVTRLENIGRMYMYNLPHSEIDKPGTSKSTEAHASELSSTSDKVLSQFSHSVQENSDHSYV